MPRDLDLHPLDRGVDIAHRGSGTAFLAHDVPGLERVAQFELDALDREITVFREAELEVRREPLRLDRKAGGLHFVHDVAKILLDVERQHEAVVQLGAPARQPRRDIGLFPEAGDHRPQQQLLGQRHAGVRRHFEGAQLEQAEPAGRAVRRVELVDAELGAVGVAGDVGQQVAEDAVNQPGRACIRRPAGSG